ncbi:MAG: DUF6920 family protein [Bacteroidota bacterium]
MINTNDIWNSIETGDAKFSHEQLSTLPEGARRYLKHAIADNTPLATAVRLTMAGELKLNNTWSAFTAEQIIAADKGFIWQACVSRGAMKIYGHDMLWNGKAEMKWKLLNLIPVVNASNQDIYKSGIGRYAIENIWLPSVLAQAGSWKQPGKNHLEVSFEAFGKPVTLTMHIEDNGKLKTVSMQRWGKLDNNKTFEYMPFGGNMLKEQQFAGYTIPTTINVGWLFGTDQFKTKGEFFRADIKEVSFK